MCLHSCSRRVQTAMGLGMSVEVYGVVPAAMPKRANHHRAQLLVQSDKRKAVQEFVRAWKPLLEQVARQEIALVAGHRSARVLECPGLDDAIE